MVVATVELPVESARTSDPIDRDEEVLTDLTGQADLELINSTDLDTQGYYTLREAALAVDKSEQTIRRMVKANKVVHRKVRTRTGFVYLVEPRSLKELFATGTPEELEGPPSAETAAEEKPSGGAELSDFYRNELERLRQELAGERARLEERTQELIAARTQAGRWEGMAQGYERFNGQLFQRLQLLERNPRPEDEAKDITQRSAAAPRPARSSAWMVWLLGVFLAAVLASQAQWLLQRGL